MIKIDSNNIVTAWCTVGGIEGGLEVENIPDEVKTAPIGKYKYVGGEFALNPDYTEPAEEPTPTVEERLEALMTQAEFFDSAIAEIMLTI